MRDRLVELIQESVNGCARNWAEVIADHLIANGVVVKDNLVPLKCCVDFPCTTTNEEECVSIAKKTITHWLTEQFMKNDELYELRRREDHIFKKLVYEFKAVVCANKKGGAE